MSDIVSEHLGGAYVINATEFDLNAEDVMRAMQDIPELAAITRWTNDIQRRQGGMLERDRYVTPRTIFHQFDVAYDAAENDDVVSGVLETTEALAMGNLGVDCPDEDEENIWNQIIDDIDLGMRLREMWRELFIVSQFTCAVWWGRKSYKVLGTGTSGVKRKKTYENLMVPVGLTLLDPHKVVPVGNFLFNQEKLCYAADWAEKDAIDKAIVDRDSGRPGSDPMVEQLLVAPYQTNVMERQNLLNAGFPADRLYLMNPRNVFRHTATRPPYKLFADVRMKSIFELLDLKSQLKQMDRATLLGATNFIVLITKGSDTLPANPAELTNLQGMVRSVSRTPVIVGDHRLDIKIITPPTDNTLAPERYNILNAAITARLLQIFNLGGSMAGAKADDSIKLARVVGRGLESRRQMLANAIEKRLFNPVVNSNSQFTETPELRFKPKHVSLDFDPNMASYLLDLRDRGDISRETILEEIDYTQEQEFLRRKNEKEHFDSTFTPTNVPFSSPAGGSDKPIDPRTGGRTRGGNRSGGGNGNVGKGAGQAPVNPAKKSD